MQVTMADVDTEPQKRPRRGRGLLPRSVRVARGTWVRGRVACDAARQWLYGAYRKKVDARPQGVMVTGPAIAAPRDDRWLGVTPSAFTRKGLITDATRTFAGQQFLNFVTIAVARLRTLAGPGGSLVHGALW
jgi:hypothetical protein